MGGSRQESFPLGMYINHILLPASLAGGIKKSIAFSVSLAARLCRTLVNKISIRIPVASEASDFYNS